MLCVISFFLRLFEVAEIHAELLEEDERHHGVWGETDLEKSINLKKKSILFLTQAGMNPLKNPIGPSFAV